MVRYCFRSVVSQNPSTHNKALQRTRIQHVSHARLKSGGGSCAPLKAVVRLLSLIKSMKFVLTIVIACSLVTVASAQRQKNRWAGTLVDANKPVVFIAFLRSAEIEPLEMGVGNRYLWFRITNNSLWPIWLDMSGVPKAYGDAGLFYTIENKDDGKIRIDSRCHACSVNPVGSGRSVVFSVPADHASQDSRMRLEYSFAWERDNETEGGSYSKHSVLFYFSYLPKSAFSTTAQSNKALQLTPR